MNKVILIGNLTRKPELKEVKETKICDFSIAVNKAKEGVDYIDCVSFGKLAETMVKHLEKGSKIALEGRLSVNVYEVEGKKKKKVDVLVESMEFLSPKKENNSSVPLSITTESLFGSQIEIKDEDLPW